MAQKQIHGALISKMFEPLDFEIIRCPFCVYPGIEIKPGKSVCPECGTAERLMSG